MRGANPIRVIIVGFGVVGRGVARSMLMERERMLSTGMDLRLVGIADLWGCMVDEGGLDIAELCSLDGVLARKTSIDKNMSSYDLIEKADYDILVETTPTNKDTGEPGLGHIKAALKGGKHVVTSNKGPIVLAYGELSKLAEENNVRLCYEATVGGAMPIINLAREALAGNTIISVKGIFNGTCNYILTRMVDTKLPYEHALSEAQELGYAEADPTYDVEGYDTASKLVIIANTIFGMNSKLSDVEVMGITRVTPEAIKLAGDSGYSIKLIGEVSRDGSLSVAPRMVPKNHQLNVHGTLNAALIETDLAGEITVTGKGAGSIEAASAIMGDIASIWIELYKT